MCYCGAVVKELLASADELGSAPGDPASVTFSYRFFFPFLFGLCFLILFFLSACFLIPLLLTLLVMHLDQFIF